MEGKRKGRRARLTMPKTAREIGNTEMAVKIVGRVFREMGSPFGRSEKDVAAEIRRRIYAQGATLAFRPIVASGRNSSFVHHKPGRKIVREDELVIFDVGAKYKGSCSDITRMHVPNSKKARRIYRDALMMQKRVIKVVRPGIEFVKLHDIYKKAMKRRGYKVMHSVGHGVGRDVHERIKGELKEGMVLAIEPGIYIKKFGGCRIEDTVFVRKGEPKILSKTIPHP